MPVRDRRVKSRAALQRMVVRPNDRERVKRVSDEHFVTLTALAEVSRQRRPAPRRRDVAERMAQLPMAQPEHAITQLTTMLDEYRMDIWPRGERLRALRSMVPLVNTLEASVQAQLANASHPLPVSKARLMRVTLSLLQGLGDAFALGACELCSASGKLPLLGRGRVIAALNQAIRYDQATFLLASQLGRAVPSGVWRHLHAVYGIATHWDMDKRLWRDVSAKRESCVRDRYVEVLLLALSGPYSFQQREWPDIEAASAALAPLAQLRTDHEGIAVAVDGPDSGPGHAVAGRELSDSCDWSLDLTALLTTLDEAIDAATVETVTLNLRRAIQVCMPRVLARHLSEAWHGNVERGQPRLPGAHSMATLPGLHDLHRALARGKDFDAYVQRLSGKNIEVGEHANAAAWLTAGVAETGTPMIEARVLDQSVGGYRLVWPSAHRLRVKVGELVGLAPGFDAATGAAPALWLVGVVRWLRSDPDTGLTAGVVVLARDARAAVVRLIDADGRRDRAQRGLLISSDVDGEAVLMAHLTDRTVRALELSCDEDAEHGLRALRDIRCRIGSLDPISGACDRVSLADVQTGLDQAP